MIYNYEIYDVFILYLTDFTTNNALNLLEECKFPITSEWERLSRDMGISLDERHRVRLLANTQSFNYATALKEAIDRFQRAGIRPFSPWCHYL